MMARMVTQVSYKNLAAHCDHCDSRQIAKKADKVIIKNVPHELFNELILTSGRDIAVVRDEGKIILYGGASSLIVPCTHLGGKHVLQLSRKKCGTVTVSRYNSNAILSSPDRSQRAPVRMGMLA